ncbi:hypothetical protein ABFS82_05G091800 [Erythranthe guttata]
MTYNAAGDEDLRMDREYVKLEGGGGDGSPPCAAAVASRYCGDGCGLGRRSLWWWGKLLLLVVFAGLFAAVIFKWIGPFLMDKGIIPIINWEMKTFSKTKLALVVFGSLTIFPSLLLPSSPSMWVAGMTFGYVYGFLLVIGAVAIGVSVPYFIGSLFYHKIQVWLDRYPKKASVIRLAGEGDSFNQFRAVAFIRISPFPYIVYNYCAVATDVKYGPYLLGTLVGMVPEIFVTLYTGIFIKTLADASYDQQSLTASQIILNLAGFCITATTTAIVTLYAKRRLKELKTEEAIVLK